MREDIRDHIVRRVEELKALVDRAQTASAMTNPAKGIVNVPLESLIAAREIARTELQWCAGIETSEPAERTFVGMWRIGASFVDVATTEAIAFAFSLVDNAYVAFLEEPPDDDDRRELNELVYDAGQAMAWMIGIREAVDEFLARPIGDRPH